jgi:hypothetical protein
MLARVCHDSLREITLPFSRKLGAGLWLGASLPKSASG